MDVAAGKDQAVERVGIWLLNAPATATVAGWAMQVKRCRGGHPTMPGPRSGRFDVG
jgi:hypothetical protein